ncbi:MAG: glycosyltransferase family 87 protein [Acidobacteriota bacterium]
MSAVPSAIGVSGPSGSRTAAKPAISYRKSLWSAVAAALVLCAFWGALGIGVVGAAQHHDFLTTYTGARMAAAGEYSRMHDPSLMFQRMREIDPQMLGAPVVRPHFYAFLVSPLARLDVHTAFWVWLGIQAAALLGCWIWAVRRFGPDSLIWGALSIPCVLGIFHGQDCILMLAIAIGGFALAERNRQWADWAAGAVWALALMKFHLVLFLLPAMLVSKRWRMAGGFTGMAVVLVAWCYALAGANGLATYVALLRDKSLERLNPTPEMMISIQGMLVNLHVNNENAALALGAIAMVIAAVSLRATQPLWRWVALALTTSLFAAPHVYGYDAAMLMLPIWLVQAYSTRPATRVMFALCALPLSFMAGLAGAPWTILSSVFLAGCFFTLAWEAWSASSDAQAQSAKYGY